LGQQGDFSYCLATDIFEFVPKLRHRGRGMAFVK
jgi:phosphosulfolactate phosphohydrolase-like enzyme